MADAALRPPLTKGLGMRNRVSWLRIVVGIGVVVGLAGAGWLWWARTNAKAISVAKSPPITPGGGTHAPDSATVQVSMSEDQQRSIGLKTERVKVGSSHHVSLAPGRIAPNENQYAFITPRAPGVVRSVTARIGQEVKAGGLLATVDSPVVGEARLDLYTKLQVLDIAISQADWEATIYHNTTELLERLRKGESPQEIHKSFSERALGENREKLMTAYAQYRLAHATIERNRDLFAQKLITPKQFEQVNADYEVAQATYQSLMDEMGYQAKLAYTRAQQSRRQAETAVRAAQERLRILGVMPDGTEPEVQGGKVVGVEKDGTLTVRHGKEAPPAAAKETILPRRSESDEVIVKPPGARGTVEPNREDAPVSTYSIWAPFDGTILDREMIVPGVAVDTTHRIFTLANLATVWVEASVHESDFEVLDRARSRGAGVRFRSPAYPGRLFEGEVIYTGDLVEEQTRTVKLLAKAPNPDRLLKPGMFVEVEVLSPRTDAAIQIPASAVITDGSLSFVYLRRGPEQFVRRQIDAEPPRDGLVTVHSGLKEDEEVVVDGAYKLKALAFGVTVADR